MDGSFVTIGKVFEHFLIMTLIGNIIWLVSSFMIVFGMKRKSALIIKIYLVLMVFCFIIMTGTFIFWKLNIEKCNVFKEKHVKFPEKLLHQRVRLFKVSR